MKQLYSNDLLMLIIHFIKYRVSSLRQLLADKYTSRPITGPIEVTIDLCMYKLLSMLIQYKYSRAVSVSCVTAMLWLPSPALLMAATVML